MEGEQLEPLALVIKPQPKPKPKKQRARLVSENVAFDASRKTKTPDARHSAVNRK